MPAQELVTSVPAGVIVIRWTEKLSVAFKYHEGYGIVPSTFHASTLAVSCLLFGWTLTRGRRAGAGAERCCRLSSSGPATAATSVTAVVASPCQVLCLWSVPMAGMTQGLQGAHLPPLVSSPPPAHPAVHVKPWRWQALASHYRPPFKPKLGHKSQLWKEREKSLTRVAAVTDPKA